MYGTELYSAVRQFVVVEGHSKCRAAQVFGLGRNTVRKMCTHSEPPGILRCKPAGRPRLGPFIEHIDAILLGDMAAPKKQRHTVKWILQRLRTEHGYVGSYAALWTYVKKARGSAGRRSVWGPTREAHVVFVEVVGVIAGVRQKMHLFCMAMPASKAWFIKAYPPECPGAFVDAHRSVFDCFGEVPESVQYCKGKLVDSNVRGDLDLVRAFRELERQFSFRSRIALLDSGSVKWKIEGLIKSGARIYLVPAPVAESYDLLNSELRANCLIRTGKNVRAAEG